MVLLLNYIYNNDLFTEVVSYPYFMIATFDDPSGTFDLISELNEALKSRRRYVDHDLICIVL
jgi:hypothetical protein